MAGCYAGDLRFFMPTAAFYTALEPYKSIGLVDAGAGTGMVSKDLTERGFRMLAVDLMPREGQGEHVIQMEAESVPYGPNLWLLLCRPDHSGWVYDTMQRALARGAGVFYAGLERNFSIDLDDYVGRETMRYANVGEEEESLFFFEPTC
jgi:hypothetical protein